jgi:16S rRNA (guanine527-N7)-methyltransferase
MTSRPQAPIATPEAFAEAFDVSRETLDRLATYEALLKHWQKTINLVAPSTLGEIWHRHFADSAQLLRLAPPGATFWVDMGSGAGFPGLVIAILLAGRGDPFRMVLIESDSRKAAFLGEVARKTGVAVEILVERIEKTATQNKFGPIDVVTARALAPLPRLLELVAPIFSPRSLGLFLKGKDAAAEVEQARARWSFDCRLVPSLTDGAGRVVVIENLYALKED